MLSSGACNRTCGRCKEAELNCGSHNPTLMGGVRNDYLRQAGYFVRGRTTSRCTTSQRIQNQNMMHTPNQYIHLIHYIKRLKADNLTPHSSAPFHRGKPAKTTRIKIHPGFVWHAHDCKFMGALDFCMWCLKCHAPFIFPIWHQNPCDGRNILQWQLHRIR